MNIYLVHIQKIYSIVLQHFYKVYDILVWYRPVHFGSQTYLFRSIVDNQLLI